MAGNSQIAQSQNHIRHDGQGFLDPDIIVADIAGRNLIPSSKLCPGYLVSVADADGSGNPSIYQRNGANDAWVQVMGGDSMSGSVTSVNGETGAVTLDTSEINEAGGDNYYTTERANLKQDVISDLNTIRTDSSAGATHATVTTGNPHDVLATQITDFGTVVSNNVSVEANSQHRINTSNPHSVTATQVGLGNVDNTSDTAKPVSTATQTALDSKSDVGHHHDDRYVRFDGDGQTALTTDQQARVRSAIGAGSSTGVNATSIHGISIQDPSGNIEDNFILKYNGTSLIWEVDAGGNTVDSSNIIGIINGASETIDGARIPTLNQDTTGNATSADTVDVSTTSANQNQAVLTAAGTDGSPQTIRGNGSLTYNHSSNLLNVTNLAISGTLTGDGSQLTGISGDVDFASVAEVSPTTRNSDDWVLVFDNSASNGLRRISVANLIAGLGGGGGATTFGTGATDVNPRAQGNDTTPWRSTKVVERVTMSEYQAIPSNDRIGRLFFITDAVQEGTAVTGGGSGTQFGNQQALEDFITDKAAFRTDIGVTDGGGDDRYAFASSGLLSYEEFTGSSVENELQGTISRIIPVTTGYTFTDGVGGTSLPHLQITGLTAEQVTDLTDNTANRIAISIPASDSVFIGRANGSSGTTLEIDLFYRANDDGTEAIDDTTASRNFTGPNPSSLFTGQIMVGEIINIAQNQTIYTGSNGIAVDAGMLNITADLSPIGGLEVLSNGLAVDLDATGSGLALGPEGAPGLSVNVGNGLILRNNEVTAVEASSGINPTPQTIPVTNGMISTTVRSSFTYHVNGNDIVFADNGTNGGTITLSAAAVTAFGLTGNITNPSFHFKYRQGVAVGPFTWNIDGNVGFNAGTRVLTFTEDQWLESNEVGGASFNDLVFFGITQPELSHDFTLTYGTAHGADATHFVDSALTQLGSNVFIGDYTVANNQVATLADVTGGMGADLTGDVTIGTDNTNTLTVNSNTTFNEVPVIIQDSDENNWLRLLNTAPLGSFDAGPTIEIANINATAVNVGDEIGRIEGFARTANNADGLDFDNVTAITLEVGRSIDIGFGGTDILGDNPRVLVNHNLRLPYLTAPTTGTTNIAIDSDGAVVLGSGGGGTADGNQVSVFRAPSIGTWDGTTLTGIPANELQDFARGGSRAGTNIAIQFPDTTAGQQLYDDFTATLGTAVVTFTNTGQGGDATTPYALTAGQGADVPAARVLLFPVLSVNQALVNSTETNVPTNWDLFAGYWEDTTGGGGQNFVDTTVATTFDTFGLSTTVPIPNVTISNIDPLVTPSWTVGDVGHIAAANDTKVVSFVVTAIPTTTTMTVTYTDISKGNNVSSGLWMLYPGFGGGNADAAIEAGVSEFGVVEVDMPFTVADIVAGTDNYQITAVRIHNLHTAGTFELVAHGIVLDTIDITGLGEFTGTYGISQSNINAFALLPTPVTQITEITLRRAGGSEGAPVSERQGGGTETLATGGGLTRVGGLQVDNTVARAHNMATLSTTTLASFTGGVGPGVISFAVRFGAGDSALIATTDANALNLTAGTRYGVNVAADIGSEITAGTYTMIFVDTTAGSAGAGTIGHNFQFVRRVDSGIEGDNQFFANTNDNNTAGQDVTLHELTLYGQEFAHDVIIDGSLILDVDNIPASDPGIRGHIYRRPDAGEQLLLISI